MGRTWWHALEKRYLVKKGPMERERLENTRVDEMIALKQVLKMLLKFWFS
jgi:hypothetical protein